MSVSMDIQKDMRASLEVLIEKRLSRRGFVRGGALAVGSAALAGCATSKNVGKMLQGVMESSEVVAPPAAFEKHAPLTFTEIAKNSANTHQLAEGYEATRLLSWGDGLIAGAPEEFDPTTLTAEQQALSFGYNNDYTAYFPLKEGSDGSIHGLLHVNHEYTNTALMFEDLPKDFEWSQMTARQVRIEQQSLGGSVVEVRKEPAVWGIGGGWGVVQNSPYNRRITATTPIYIAGPAAGHPRMQTSADPQGMLARGTMANCAGGTTPWGTVLMAEENVNYYFSDLRDDNPEYANHTRMGIREELRNGWSVFDARFNVEKEPNEPNRFGWVVEYDPYNPDRPAVKRTALGRFKHECANTVLAPDGRLVVYSGDDEQFEYVYRFVTARAYDPDNRDANLDLLDDGTLFVAKFDGEGSVTWLPLIYGQHGLTKENGFASQGDVLIDARRAGDTVGATPMDRPEDVEVNPVTSQLFITLTKNKRRETAEEDAANPRGPNPFGHILELTAPVDTATQMPDHSADVFEWNVFLAGGNPEISEHRAGYIGGVTQAGWLTNPDNIAFDVHGRIWICTDGQGSAIDKNDGLYAAQTEGVDRGKTKLFFTSPTGAEITGPSFTPDGKTLFLAVQHPGEGRKSHYNDPITRWPDFRDDLPPRPSVIAITKKDDGIIGE